MNNVIDWFIDPGINLILYGVLILASLWTAKNIMMSSLRVKFLEWKYKYRIRKIRHEGEFTPVGNFKSPLLKHLYFLLRTTRDNRDDFDVISFLILSGLLFFSTTIFVFIVINDLLVALIIGFLLSLIPYLFLRLRLNNIRHLMSKEFLTIVQQITQNYNTYSFNMYHALTETQKDIEEKHLREVIVKLVSDLQVSRNEHELRESIQVFAYTAGTNWAKRLGSIILKAYLYDENVLNALMTLTKQIEETQEMLEEEKASVIDHVYNGYLTLPIFIASLFLGYFSSGVQNWWHLQFGHKSTLFLFTLSVVGVLFSIVIAVFLKRPKNDL